jgi:Ribbon-helix-helix protein, copG family
MLASDAMASRRTTVSADVDDLAVLEAEARKRGVSLTRILREAVEREADRLRRKATPRFGIVHGNGTATESIASDEHAPARRRARS